MDVLKEIDLPTVPSSDKKTTELSEKEKKKQALVKEAKKMARELLEAAEKARADAIDDTEFSFSQNPLKAFAAAETVTVDKFVASGGLLSISMALKQYCISMNVVDIACRIFGTLIYHNSSILDEVLKSGAIDSILSGISGQMDMDSEEAMVSALKTLRSLTQTEEMRISIHEAKGLHVIIALMKKSTNSPRLLSHGALLLSNLAFGSSDIKDSIGGLGGISAISKGMMLHTDYQGMQARGSLALRNLCYNSELNQKIAGENDAADALVKAIEKYIDDREVVHQSCVALANLTNTNEDNRKRVVDAKGTVLLVKLMQMHSDSVTVNDDCISVIRNISVGNPAGQLEAGACGGIGRICAAMHKFEKQGKIAGKACAALRYLCFSSENRDRVREEQGMEAITNIFKSHGNDAKIVENALLAVGNATFDHNENKAVIGRCGGTARIISAIEQHRLSPMIQEHGCRVLRNLADGCEFNQILEAENGAITVGIVAMMGYPESASIQEQALAMLLNITLSAGNIEKVKKAEAGRLAEKSMAMHPKHRGVQLQAASILDRLEEYSRGALGDSHSDGAENGSNLFGLRSLSRAIGRRK